MRLLFLFSILFCLRTCHAQTTFIKELVWQGMMNGHIDTTKEGNIVLCGASSSSLNSPSDAIAMLIDTNGNVLNTRIINSPNADLFKCIVQTFDGGFVACGYTKDNGFGDIDAMIAKFDSALNVTWIKIIGNPERDEALHVIQTADSNFVIGGISYNNGFSNNLVFKCDQNGNLLWQKVFGTSNNDVT
ncbi:MAG: hypothetical protein IPP29_15845 [Bacteroidetes bacterium]|nr:hypothetical protein [Bacteroidota bacterium]